MEAEEEQIELALAERAAQILPTPVSTFFVPSWLRPLVEYALKVKSLCPNDNASYGSTRRVMPPMNASPVGPIRVEAPVTGSSW